MKIFMKTSDISNECRPVSVAEAWLECMLNEFFNQVYFANHSNQNSQTFLILKQLKWLSKYYVIN